MSKFEGIPYPAILTLATLLMYKGCLMISCDGRDDLLGFCLSDSEKTAITTSPGSRVSAVDKTPFPYALRGQWHDQSLIATLLAAHS